MQKTKKVFFVAGLFAAEVFLLFRVSALPVFSAPITSGTFVSGDISSDTVWNVGGSPYVFTGDVNVISGVTLRIMPGVKITKSPNLYGAELVIYGDLEIEGSEKDPVDITGIDAVSVHVTSSHIYHSNFHDGPYIYLVNANLTIASTTITKSKGSSLYVEKSAVNGWNLKIENASQSGIFVDSANGAIIPAQSLPDKSKPMLADLPVVLQSSVTVHRSSFIENFAAVTNMGSSLLRLENNWWGTSTGPILNGLNSISGPVLYEPWLIEDPTKQSKTTCCSNVIFLPGLEGTRMYTGSNQLWEPNRNADVQRLYLNSDGSSVDQHVYSGNAVGSAFGIKNIYAKFLLFLENLTKTGVVNEAKVFGYDWRKPIVEVVMGSEKRATTTESLLDIVEVMASSSKTGKVTVIAHSNGGLVAKYLVKALSDIGKADIIDKIISVAVPYLGTPEAILALLHGDHQSILGGFIASQATMRGLGKNMSSAYSLLPSAEYFARVFSPAIVFASTTVYGANRGAYPQFIKNATDLNSYVGDFMSVREKPSPGDTALPIVGNRALLTAAGALHDILDSFDWPAAVARWAIVGWNRLTTLTVNYEDDLKCTISFLVKKCRFVLGHSASTTYMGDGTVVSPSAAFEGGVITSVDLGEVSNQEKSKFDHANILEASSTQAIVRQIIINGNSGNDDTTFVLPKGVALGEPNYSGVDKMSLLLSTHSPVELHIYDSKGNHTGLIPKPLKLAQNDFVSGAFETEIPGSTFRVYADGDGDSDTYISLPDGNGQEYSVIVEGTDFGFFTFEAERFDGVKSVEKVRYSMEPVTPLSVATTSVTGRDATAGAPGNVSLAASILPLNVDIEGDGSVDYRAVAGGTGFPGNATTLEIANMNATAIFNDVMKKVLKTATPNDKRRLEIMKKLDRITNLAKMGKLKQREKKEQKLVERLGHIKLKKMSSNEKQKLTDKIEALIDSVE